MRLKVCRYLDGTQLYHGQYEGEPFVLSFALGRGFVYTQCLRARPRARLLTAT